MTQDDIGRSVLLHGHTCLVCRLSSRCCVRVLCIPCLCVCECFCHSTARVPYTCVLSFRQPADIVAEVNRLCAPKVEFMDSPSLVSFFSYNIFFNFFWWRWQKIIFELGWLHCICLAHYVKIWTVFVISCKVLLMLSSHFKEFAVGHAQQLTTLSRGEKRRRREHKEKVAYFIICSSHSFG